MDEEFDAKVKDITDLYISAIERHLKGERTISIDEMTGIQATERCISFDKLEIPDKKSRVCLTGISTRVSIRRQLTDKQGKLGL